MKKIFFSFLLLLCFTAQQIQARAVLSGESLWAMQRLVTQASCDVTIRQVDLSAGVFTISTSGVYCLAENITGKIVIDTNNVVLDLNGKTMTNASGNCVEVNGTSNALIKNGSVIAANDIGVSVLTGSDQVSVKNVTSYDCSTGIDIDNATNIYIHACDLIASSVGVAFTTVSRAQVSDTTASDSELTGFLLDSSSRNLFTNCHALNTGEGLTDETANIYGFLSADGSSNIFSECVAQNTLALTVTGISNVTAGFALTGTESNSQITKCTSSIVETNANGFAVPYGILLQYSFDALTTITGGNQGIASGALTVAWSPDGTYLATGGNTEGTNEIQIFSFDRVTGTLTKTDGQNQGTACESFSWSSDGLYLATGGVAEGGDEIQIFTFDRVAGTLTKIDGQSLGETQRGVAWSQNGVFLATGGDGPTGDEIRVFFFNRSTESLTFIVGANQGSGCNAVAWSPDGAYLATVGAAEGGDEIQIFSFNQATDTLTKTDGQDQGTTGRTVAWSPDGAYLATGGDGGGNNIQVFSFNSSTGVLTFVAGATQGGAGRATDWSPDGAFLVTVGDTEGVTDEIQVFSFNRETGQLTKVDGKSQGLFAGLSTNWSPDGVYLVTGGNAEGFNEFQVFKAFLFPSRNTIMNNIVQSVSRSSSVAAGVGISGSSIENFIAVNSSYDNAGFNYQFVTNVFDERFTTIPTIAQNLSIKLSPFFYAP